MNNIYIVWKWNPETQEWELPKIPKKDLAEIEIERIIPNIKKMGDQGEQEYIRKKDND